MKQKADIKQIFNKIFQKVPIMAKTLLLFFPLQLILMVLYVQVISYLSAPDFYNINDLTYSICWVFLAMLPYVITEKRFIYIIILTIVFIGNFLNLLHILTIECPINETTLYTIVNTNISETRDFISMSINIRHLLLIPFLAIYIWGISRKKSIHQVRKSKLTIIIFVILLSIFLGRRAYYAPHPKYVTPPTFQTSITFVENIKSIKELKKRNVITIDAQRVSNTEQPCVFVLIIGESCNRNRMSLYNYNRKTTPLLEKRTDIICYNNVVSGYSNTLQSVLSLLTESNLENKKAPSQSISLVDVFHSARFKTYWLSNQAPRGWIDESITNIAKTCDNSNFVNEHGSKEYYDENLFPMVNNALKDTCFNKFLIIHLMGSHANYAKRYPPNFEKFKEYSSKTEKIINEYDNSILYNDFIVDSIFNILSDYTQKHKTTIGSAVYLSDHGENVYDEFKNHGHAYAHILPKANVEVPFIVWLSPQFHSAYQNKCKHIANNASQPFVTDDLFHAAIDLNDISTLVFDKTRSLFNLEFNFKRIRILEDNHDYDSPNF